MIFYKFCIKIKIIVLEVANNKKEGASMEKKNIDWADLGFGYVKTDKRYVSNFKDGKWDDVKMKGLHDHLIRKHKESKIICNIVDTTDYRKGIEGYIEKHKIDLVTTTTHRRGFLSRIMNPNLSKKMLFHTDLPLLVFHD